jgi:glycosidase
LNALCIEIPTLETKAEQQQVSVKVSEYAVLAVQRLKIASCLQFFLPGTPCVYYGDEVGLEGYKDPLNRRPYPYGKENFTVLKHYERLGGIRKNYKSDFSSRGDFEIQSSGGVVKITRGDLVLIINNSNTAVKLHNPVKNLLTNKPVNGIPPSECVIYSSDN